MPFELLIGAAVGAGLASESGRKAIRKGVVYSLAGALMAYDRMAALASEVRGARKGSTEPATANPANTTANTPQPAQGAPARLEVSASPTEHPAEPVAAH
jgi:hypothetical protein